MIKLSAITAVIWKPKSQNDRMKAEWGLLHKPVVAVSVTNCDNIYGRYNTFPFSTCFPAPPKSASIYWLFRNSFKQANYCLPISPFTTPSQLALSNFPRQVFVGEHRRRTNDKWAVAFIAACSEENKLIPQIWNGKLSISAVVGLHGSPCINEVCVPNSEHLSKFVCVEQST